MAAGTNNVINPQVYGLYSYLERELYLQERGIYPPAEGAGVSEASGGDVDYGSVDLPPFPPRYSSLILPDDWFLRGDGRYARAGTQGLVSSGEMAAIVADRWFNADGGVIDFCRAVAQKIKRRAEEAKFREEDPVIPGLPGGDIPGGRMHLPQMTQFPSRLQAGNNILAVSQAAYAPNATQAHSSAHLAGGIAIGMAIQQQQQYQQQVQQQQQPQQLMQQQQPMQQEQQMQQLQIEQQQQQWQQQMQQQQQKKQQQMQQEDEVQKLHQELQMQQQQIQLQQQQMQEQQKQIQQQQIQIQQQKIQQDKMQQQQIQEQKVVQQHKLQQNIEPELQQSQMQEKIQQQMVQPQMQQKIKQQTMQHKVQQKIEQKLQQPRIQKKIQQQKIQQQKMCQQMPQQQLHMHQQMQQLMQQYQMQQPMHHRQPHQMPQQPQHREQQQQEAGAGNRLTDNAIGHNLDRLPQLGHPPGEDGHAPDGGLSPAPGKHLEQHLERISDKDSHPMAEVQGAVFWESLEQKQQPGGGIRGSQGTGARCKEKTAGAFDQADVNAAFTHGMLVRSAGGALGIDQASVDIAVSHCLSVARRMSAAAEESGRAGQYRPTHHSVSRNPQPWPNSSSHNPLPSSNDNISSLPPSNDNNGNAPPVPSSSANDNFIAKFLNMVAACVPEIAPAVAALLPKGGTDPDILGDRGFPEVVAKTLAGLRSMRTRAANGGTVSWRDLFARVDRCIGAIERGEAWLCQAGRCGNTSETSAGLGPTLRASSPSDNNHVNTPPAPASAPATPVSTDNNIIELSLNTVVACVPKIVPAVADLLPEGDTAALGNELSNVITTTLAILRLVRQRAAGGADEAIAAKADYYIKAIKRSTEAAGLAPPLSGCGGASEPSAESSSSFATTSHEKTETGFPPDEAGGRPEKKRRISGDLNASPHFNDSDGDARNGDLVSKFLKMVVSSVPELALALGCPSILRRAFPDVVAAALAGLRAIWDRAVREGSVMGRDLATRVGGCIRMIELHEPSLAASGGGPPGGRDDRPGAPACSFHAEELN